MSRAEKKTDYGVLYNVNGVAIIDSAGTYITREYPITWLHAQWYEVKKGWEPLACSKCNSSSFNASRGHGGWWTTFYLLCEECGEVVGAQASITNSTFRFADVPTGEER